MEKDKPIRKDITDGNPTMGINAVGLNIGSWSTPATSSSKSVSVTSYYSWTLYSDASWLTTSVSSGSGNGSFTIKAASNNTSSVRDGAIQWKSSIGEFSQVIVTQAAGSPPDDPVELYLSPSTWDTSAEQDDITIVEAN